MRWRNDAVFQTSGTPMINIDDMKAWAWAWWAGGEDNIGE